MFTGIVETTGTVKTLELQGDSAVLGIEAPEILTDVEHGASIAVNGVCLTVVDFDAETFQVDVMAETLRRSSIGDLAVGGRVNLERAMPATGRFGGHIVQGHVDGTGSVRAIHESTHWTTVHIDAEPNLTQYIVEKGSITVDGVSLTVASLEPGGFTVSLIPTTLALTALGDKRIGDIVNLEVDIVAKYVERLLTASKEHA